MAVSSSAVWEVRTGGTANAGGFFVTGASGTDYSQQDAVQTAFTDAVIDGADNTKVTSAASPFTVDMIGNGFRVVSGTGWTVGWYEITAVNGSNEATLDRAVGTVGSTGGTANMGGALDHLTTLPIADADEWVAGQKVFVQGHATSTYDFASTMTPAIDGSDGTHFVFEGYLTTRGDDKLATLKCTNAAANPMIRVDGDRYTFKNLKFDGDGTAPLLLDFRALHGALYGCEGTDSTGGGFSWGSGATSGSAIRCVSHNNGGSGFLATAGPVLFHGCVGRDNTGDGFFSQNNNAIYSHCIAHDNTADGFAHLGSHGPRYLNVTSDGNGGDGIELDGTFVGDVPVIINALLTNNTGYAIDHVNGVDLSSDLSLTSVQHRVATFNNTAGVRNRWPAGTNDITLTADPYTSASGDDYSLNSTTGGGAAVINVGEPGGFGTLNTETSTGKNSVGAVIPTSAASTSDTTNMRDCFREYTNERNTTVVPDSVVDFYIEAGLEALNRRLKYHITDSTSDVTLVDGTQEYTLPTDVVEIQWVRHNGKELEKRDIEAWRRDYVDWKDKPPSWPKEYVHYANKIVIRPEPSADAVAADSTLEFRYVSTPVDFTANGPLQLDTQSQRVACYYAVAEWAAAYPESERSVALKADFFAKFETEVNALIRDYKDRMVEE